MEYAPLEYVVKMVSMDSLLCCEELNWICIMDIMDIFQLTTAIQDQSMFISLANNNENIYKCPAYETIQPIEKGYP